MSTQTQHIIGAFLRRHRIAAGLSQGDMAERVGASRLTISKMENGKSSSLPILIACLDELHLLDRFESLFAPAPISPIEQLRAAKANTPPTAKRVSRKQKPTQVREATPEWKWGDET